MTTHDSNDKPVVLDVRVVKGSGGGPDKTILNSPRHLDPLGYRMLCAYLHAPGDPGIEQLRRKAERWGTSILSIPDRGPLDLSVLPRLLGICRRAGVTIFHGHDYKSNVLGLLLRQAHRMRLVTTIHGWVHHTRRTPIYYALDRWSLPWYERVICVSPDLHDTCLDAGVRPERCLVLDNAVATDEFRRRQNGRTAKAALGFSSHSFLIGAVGRLSPEKGFDVLLRAASLLRASGANLEVAIVGEGEELPNLQRLASELELGACVHFLGYRSDLRPVYEALDCFALSSLREGLPNVVLEAMAMQAPVVATRIAGVPRLIRDGETGLLVEPGSAQALAAALQRLVGDCQLREQFAQAGRQLVERDFSFPLRMRRLAGIYDQLLERSANSQEAGLPAMTPT